MKGILIIGGKALNLALVTLINEEEEDVTLISLIGGELVVLSDPAERKVFSQYIRGLDTVDLTPAVEHYRRQALMLSF